MATVNGFASKHLRNWRERFIGDRLSADRNMIYYARFCQLIFSYYCPNLPVLNAEKIKGFKLNKRAFKDPISRDGKKV